MTYTPTPQERINMRYTIARLEPLRTSVEAVRNNMEQIALQVKDKGLRGNILNFVSETGPCQIQIKTYIDSLQLVFPVSDLSRLPAHKDDGYITDCPFECANFYENKIVKNFRAILNDYKVIQEVRTLMRSQLNEILYSFLKIRMLNSFSPKELRAETNLF